MRKYLALSLFILVTKALLLTPPNSRQYGQSHLKMSSTDEPNLTPINKADPSKIWAIARLQAQAAKLKAGK